MTNALQYRETGLHWFDFCVIIAYFVGLLVIGFWSSRKSNGKSVAGYFLANRDMHWIPVGASLFATTVGSDAFVGLAGAGASSGIGISAIELHAMYILLILGWFFVPVYMSAKVNTMPEYLNKRFGGQRIRVYLSVLSLFIFIFLGISIDLYSGALFIKQALGLNMYISVVILIGISALLTITGGLRSVLWTNLVQTIIMFAGAVVLMAYSLAEVGGYYNLMNNFESKSEPTDPQYIAYRDNCDPNGNKTCISCSRVNKYYNHLLRPATDPELPSTGLVFGLTVSAVWFWCTNQVTVQRALAAKSISHAKAGCTLCSFLKVFNVYLIVLTGMAARVLWPNEIGCSNPEMCKSICGSENGCSNIAYPLLVLRLMPNGLTGLMLSVMMAALMSSLSSIFNSSSTIFTIDIYTRFRKSASEREQVIAGRIFVMFSMAISILWIPIIQSAHESQLFHYIQGIIACIAPPVCAVYVLAVFWSRITEKGAFWALIVGLLVGIIRFILELSYTVPTCASGEPDPRPLILSEVHYLHFGIILFIISCIVAIVISLMTDPMDEQKIIGLTFSTRYCEPIEGTGGLKKSSEQRNKVGFDLNKNGLNVIESKLSEDVVKDGIKCAKEAKEEPFWRCVNNFCAIIVIGFASFIWGFYA